ncbi:Glycosyltransferase 28 domain protein [uncultured Paludibacter sp.]|uniref:Glycosyltransferase 28 domain protein n=1 Tax=uncultured Paludibacter sp. TaxID=497635 RepID=A0A653AFQ8_9BACT|nr:Glycosyltransferase 28 domain protein [uncultured Paludibacter sp.]
MNGGEKILVCPLNWGLGHASRCVPIIHTELEKGNEEVIASDGFPLKFLQQQFPELRTIEFPSYPVKYSKGKSQFWAMLVFLPKLLNGIKQENKRLKQILEQEHFDVVISDNRFGLWNKNVHSVYITHQIMVKMPKILRFLECVGYRLHKYIIEKYNECWIPDFEKNGGLSGDLSHKYPLPKNAKFIGTLSRFTELKKINPNDDFETVVVISGVEPQRTIFENSMIEKYQNQKEKTLIVQGLPSKENHLKTIGNITLLSHLGSKELAAALKGCNKIVCRAGYSTIMDLDALDCLQKAIFYPTPGQTEQEYLAEYHSKK